MAVFIVVRTAHHVSQIIILLDIDWAEKFSNLIVFSTGGCTTVHHCIVMSWIEWI